MELADALYEQYSKAGMKYIAGQVISGAWPFQELWAIINTGDRPLPQRAAWAMDHTLERQPELMHTILDDAVGALLQPQHDAVYRMLLKGFDRLPDIPEDHQGVLYDRAIRWILDPKAGVAVRVFSISLAAKIAADIPELQEEVCLAIESQLEYGSAGFCNRGGKVLKRFRKRS
ncbi:hypothetical protein [Phaeodactylibacter sp.]|uniref:hypothetical protein n=1 Tax=Phaeodactylibacter sp. TaxID=1940289 RepID=UPI0032EDA6C5